MRTEGECAHCLCLERRALIAVPQVTACQHTSVVAQSCRMTQQATAERHAWCATFARALIRALPSVPRSDALPIAHRFFVTSQRSDPIEAVEIALRSSSIRRADRESKGVSDPSQFEQRR